MDVAAAPAPAVVQAPSGPTANDLGNQSDEQFAKTIGLEEVFADATEQQKARDAADEAAAARKKGATPPAKPGEPKPDEAPPTDAYWQDQTGKWHRPDGEYADADESQAAAEIAGVAPSKEAAPVPDGQAPAKPSELPATPAPTPRKVPFTVESDDGTPDAEIPNLTLTFTADGREYKKPLDDVVRLAQMGTYNERREAEVIQAKQMVNDAQQRQSQYDQAIQERDAFIAALLADENLYVERATDYRTQNSPQVQLQRLQQQRQQELLQTQQNAQMQNAMNYIQQAITPKFDALLKQFPEVSNEEATMMLTRMVAPLAVNGVVPTNRFPEVERIIDRELAPWIEDRHTTRASRLRTTEARARLQVDAARIRAQAAQNRLARASNGQGTAGRPSYSAPIKPRNGGKYLSAEDTADAAIASIGGVIEER